MLGPEGLSTSFHRGHHGTRGGHHGRQGGHLVAQGVHHVTQGGHHVRQHHGKHGAQKQRGWHDDLLQQHAGQDGGLQHHVGQDVGGLRSVGWDGTPKGERFHGELCQPLHLPRPMSPD